jgi:SNF2 family DNA or RNA helicase
MIKILFNKDIKKVIIKNFSQSRELFEQTKDLLTKYGCTYNKKNNHYRCSPYIYDDLIIELKDIDEVEVHPFVIKLIEEAKITELEIKKVRPDFDSTLLKYLPLKGKHPYENYQIEDIKQVTSYNRHGCFWHMGTGKSFCVSYILTFLFKYNKIDRAIILAPPDGLTNIMLEILKFNNNMFTEHDFFIASRFNKEIFERTDYKILLCTYSTWLVLQKHFYIKSESKKKKRHNHKLVPITLEEIKADMPKCFETQTIDFNKHWGTNNNKLIMLDESHLIANPNSKISKYLHLYKNLFEYRYEFSGTPFDKYEKLYSQIKFLDDNLLPKTYNQWLMKIAICGNRFNTHAITKYKPDQVDKFLNYISPYVVRRGKEVLDLPEHIMKKNYVEMNDLQLKIYHMLIDMEMYNQDQKYHEIDFGRVFNSFPYLIQACDNPCLLQNKLENKYNYRYFDELINAIKLWKFEDHPKLEVTDYLIDKYIKEENRKMILWSYHPQTIDQLTAYYNKKYHPLHIHGQMKGVSANNHMQVIDDTVQQFKTDPDRHLLIASSTVLQRAKTITEATRQIYFDRPFKFIEFNQSSSRIYRAGTTEPVITNILIFRNSLDIHVDDIIEQKTEIDKVLIQKKYLTVDEIKSVFEGKQLDF